MNLFRQRSLPLAGLLLLTSLGVVVAQQGADASEAVPLEDEQEPELLDQAKLEALSEQIRKDIEELRGVKFKRPVKVTVSDGAGFQEYVDDRMERTTTEDQLWSDEVVMKLLGLIDPEMDYTAKQMEFLESQVGGFYDPETESFCLMDNFTGGLAKIIMAHELTHALDDQLFDIDGTLDRLKGNVDAQIAYHAVVEGSGTSLMNEWMFAHRAELDMAEIKDSDGIDMTGMAEAPAAMWKPMLMVYMRGAAFLKRTESVMEGQMGKLDLQDLEQAFTNPPRSTEQILHPEKYWDPVSQDEPIAVALDVGELEGRGWRLVAMETLGEAALALGTSSADQRGGLDISNPIKLLMVKYTNDAAEGWGGDRYVLMKKDDALFFHLVTKWDTERDAVEFYSNINLQLEGLTLAHAKLVELMMEEGAGASELTMDKDSVAYSVLLGGTADELSGLVSQVKELLGEPAPEE